MIWVMAKIAFAVFLLVAFAIILREMIWLIRQGPKSNAKDEAEFAEFQNERMRDYLKKMNGPNGDGKSKMGKGALR